MSEKKVVPAAESRAEIKIKNSRFIASIGPAFSVGEAREFIGQIKSTFSDASHNVPAFIIGHGSVVTAHCSDDGEPAGTAGRPILAVLQGSGLGDVAAVVTRYFGGTKLGTGGLVRAYGDAVKRGLELLPRAEKVLVTKIQIAVPYKLLDQAQLLAAEHGGIIIDRDFSADVNLFLQFRVDQVQDFSMALLELSNGSIEPVTESNVETIMPLSGD